MTMVERPHRLQRTDASSSEIRWRPLRLFFLFMLVVGVGAGGAYLLWRASGVADPACQEDPAHRLLPDYQLLAWSVAMVVAGRVIGPKLHPVPENERAEQLADTVGILSAMLFFAAVAFALLYEGIGVQASLDHNLLIGRFHQLEPITYYVRCAIFYDKAGTGGFGFWTYAIFGLSSFLVGHWLWARNPPCADTEPDDDEAPATRGLQQFVGPTILTLSSVVFFVAAGFWLLSLALNANPNTAAALRPAAESAPVPQTEGTFHVGIAVVIGFVTVFFLLIALLDFIFALKKWDSIGLRVQRWARANAWFAFGLLGVLGALVAHFGGNEIQY